MLEIQVGGGVTFRVPGTYWRINAEVLELRDTTIRVKGADFEGWVPRAEVMNVISPSEYVIDNAINVIGDDGV